MTQHARRLAKELEIAKAELSTVHYSCADYARQANNWRARAERAERLLSALYLAVSGKPSFVLTSDDAERLIAQIRGGNAA